MVVIGLRRADQAAGRAISRTSCRRRCRSRRAIPAPARAIVIDTVALPIEQQVNGVEDMIYMQSYSAADGSYTLTVTFKIGTDLNFAQVLVQNRVSSALVAAAAGGAGRRASRSRRSRPRSCSS